MISSCAPNTGLNLRPRLARGTAVLTTVMVLFFVMALVAAYTNRNLLYEQRMSTNNFRAVAAVSAADAGIDWALAMLNGARVNENCIAQSVPDVADIDFRSRFLIYRPDGDGRYTTPSFMKVDKHGEKSTPPFQPACVLGNPDSGWNCKCPSPTTPEPVLTYPANSAPNFLIAISSMGDIEPPDPKNPKPPNPLYGSPGMVKVESRGSHESSREQGTGLFGNYSRVNALLGLVRALPVLPVATLTAGDAITISSGSLLRVANSDIETGVALHAGSAITASDVQLIGPPGSVASVRIDTDATMLGMSNTSQFFQSVFGMDAATYSRQPAAVFVDCASGCTSSSISSAVTNHPGRIIWIAGNIELNDAATLGSATAPVMLVATGDVTLSAQLQINGFIYAGRDILWGASAAGTVLFGAAIASRNFVADSPVTMAYDIGILKRINFGYGSFVRVPGSWQVIPRL